MNLKDELIPVGGKIEIVKCSSDKYWYNSRVGESFNIHDYGVRDYYVNDNGIVRGILKIDVK